VSNQALAEMKEKIKILQNEIEILRNECKVKDRELAKECASHQGAQIQRDALRYDTNKSQAEYKKKQVRRPEGWEAGCVECSEREGGLKEIGSRLMLNIVSLLVLFSDDCRRSWTSRLWRSTSSTA
jgi:hypothetical protein